MIHLQWELESGPDELIEVTLNGPSNVMLMDPENYQNYSRGQFFQYYGGYAETSPAELRAPRPGRWHVVVDLGGRPGHLRASFLVFENAGTAR